MEIGLVTAANQFEAYVTKELTAQLGGLCGTQQNVTTTCVLNASAWTMVGTSTCSPPLPRETARRDA